MATVLRTKRGTWRADTDVKNIVGKGAYGVVCRATDGSGNRVAAKRIDTQGKDKLSQVTKHLEKFINLDHANIVKILEVHEADRVVWVIMELCDHGDLNKFFQKRILTETEKLQVMKQIATGVAYLHENNVIHRDIKPENILVACDSPILVKLTDFDVSKFLDELYATSAMSTNVGTLAYKAPEFFQRTAEGKRRYHRRVDVFATGLTYLAMIQPQPLDQKALLPRIETPQDVSERHHPSIGQLIAERIKYKVPELNIVVFDNTATSDATITMKMCDTNTKLRELIKKMTHPTPEDRASAVEVLEALKALEQVHRAIKTRLHSNVSWETDMCAAFSMCVVRGNVYVHGKVDGKYYIRVFSQDNQRVVKDIKSMCCHSDYSSSTICEHPVDNNYVLEACTACSQIRAYNVHTSKGHVVYKGLLQPSTICKGALSSVLATYNDGRILVLNWSDKTKELAPEMFVYVNGVKKTRNMCYVEQHDVVVVAGEDGTIQGVSLSGGSSLWRIQNQIDSMQINATGLCRGENGSVYVTDYDNSRILVLETRTGELLQVLAMKPDVRYILDAHWTKAQPQLTVLYGAGSALCTCNVVDTD